MSTTAIISKFDGGICEDPRTTNQNQAQDMGGFDVFTNPHQLIPYTDSVAETTGAGSMSDIQISDVDVCILAGVYTYVGVGYTAIGNMAPTFYIKTNTNAIWAAQGTGVGGYIKGTLVVYKDNAYCLAYNGSQYSLQKFDSTGTVTTVGTYNSSLINVYARPFVHPSDNVLYIVFGNVILTWNETTFNTYTTILPTGYYAVSQTNYGDYLAIAVNPNRGNGNTTTYLWGRDGTINTLQVSIDTGEGSIRLIENLNNTLFIIMNPSNYGFSVNQNKLVVKGYSGGAVSIVTSVQLTNSLITQALTYKVKNGGRVFFGFGNDTTLYSFGKNKEEQYILARDRFFNNATVIGTSFGALSMIGDTLFAGIFLSAGGFALMRSKINSFGETVTYTGTSFYKTTINPCMGLSRYTIQDKHKIKQLEAVLLEYSGASTGITTLQYSVDGSAFATIINDTNVTGEIGKEATRDINNEPLLQGREITFLLSCTGGSRPKQLAYRYSAKDTLI